MTEKLADLKRYLARKITGWFEAWSAPPLEELILKFILNTASLRLMKLEHVELAPILGTCGNFKLEGSSLPVCTYLVFEKKIMEFVEVRVEVSRPNRLEFISKISSTTAPERHGEQIECTEKYKEPFMKLLRWTFPYFGLTRKAVEFKSV